MAKNTFWQEITTKVDPFGKMGVNISVLYNPPMQKRLHGELKNHDKRPNAAWQSAFNLAGNDNTGHRWIGRAHTALPQFIGFASISWALPQFPRLCSNFLGFAPSP